MLKKAQMSSAVCGSDQRIMEDVISIFIWIRLRQPGRISVFFELLFTARITGKDCLLKVF